LRLKLLFNFLRLCIFFEEIIAFTKKDCNIPHACGIPVAEIPMAFLFFAHQIGCDHVFLSNVTVSGAEINTE